MSNCECYFKPKCRCSSREIVNRSLARSSQSVFLSMSASGSLINGHDERDFEDKKVSHMKQKRRIIAAANDNVQKRELCRPSVRWSEGGGGERRRRN